jgi:Predicted transcriptional regulators
MLSDKTRLRILLLLLEHELCVCEISAALEMSQPRVSRQLAILKQVRLIKDRREGKWIYYRIEENADTRYLMRILSLLPDWLKDDSEFKNDKTMLNKISCLKNKLESCECILPRSENIGE